MRQYFTSLQVFLAAALSLVIFIGVFGVEKSNFNKLATIEDPFESRQHINERVVVNGDAAQSWLHSTGELFLLLPGSKINFINQSRELEEGVLFLNTNFQAQAEIDASKKGFRAPFNLPEADLHGGQVRIGPAVVSVPQGIAVLKRDLVRQETEIYAYDHPVDIYLPEAKNSFLLPPGYTMLLKESRAGLLGPLYYTKLKKELNLKALEASTLGYESLQSALLEGLEVSLAWENRIADYAQKAMLEGARFAPSSVMGRFLGALGYIQRYYALGIDKPYKAEYQYDVLQKDLKNTYFALEENRRSKALTVAKDFLAVSSASSWARFFVENPGYKSRWNDFSRSQRVWFFKTFPETLESIVLRGLWGPTMEITSLQDYQENYYLFEEYYKQNFRSQAQAQLEFLETSFSSIQNLEEKDQAALSRARRQVSFLLQGEMSLRNEATFKLYSELVGVEKTALGENSELSQEIRLEVAQELLFFLKDLLDSSSRQDMAIILLRAYRNLQVAGLAENLGRSVFSAQERETLNRIQGLGTLSEEKLAAVRESNRAAADALALFDALNNEFEANTPSGPIGVQTEADFLDMLVAKKVLTQGMTLQLNEKEGNKFITFGQASYENYSLQGTFQTDGQKFSFIKLGEVTENRATLSSFEGFLNQMLSANRKLEASGRPTVQETGPNNYSSTAKLQRRNILKLLEKEGITVKLDDVLLTDVAFSKARVENASFEKQYLLIFDFDMGPPIRIRNVTVSFGRNTILLPGQVFKLETFSASLKAAIEEKLLEAEKSTSSD